MIRYLRISVTDRCNMHCRYCMPKGYLHSTPQCETLSADEIGRAAGAAVHFGIDTIRITGGEPLIRNDIIDVIHRISSCAGIKKTAITTNGSLLENSVSALKDAGLYSANISLDTLRRGRYGEINGNDQLPQVLRSISRAKDVLGDVKINCVVMRHINDDEIIDFCRFADKEKIIVRFIEFMPHLDCSTDFLFPKTEMLDLIEKNFGKAKKIAGTFGLGPAQYFTAENLKTPFGIIASVTSPPCSNCNRLRLTADGRLMPCLYSAKHFDIRRALKNGENVLPIFESAISAKASLSLPIPPRLIHNMIELGG